MLANKPESRRVRFFALGLGALMLFVVSGCQKKQQAQPQSGASPQAVGSVQTRALLDNVSAVFEQAVGKVSPSVVPVFAEETVVVQNPFTSPESPFRDFFGDDFFKRFFGTPPGQGEQKQTVHSLGSGVIVSKDGYILTNNHVVQGAEKLTIVLGDKNKVTAKIVGADPQTDVAVIKISADNLAAADLGNSDEVKVGQWVIAVGNPFQLMHTATAGIISAKGRSSVGLADYEDFIQTDASINPGNSGGALADLDGKVIGINTAISSPTGANVGIGFAIPINMARQVMEQLIGKGKVVRGYLGLLPQDLDDNLAKAMGIKGTEGALVGDVTPGGPADKAGIKRGDVLVEFNGQKIENSTHLRNLAAQIAPGTKVKVVLLRNNATKTLDVILGERPKPEKAAKPEEIPPEKQSSQKIGMTVQNLTSELADQLGYQNETGVIVSDVASGSPAEDAGLKQGDLIKEINKAAVRTVKDFDALFARLRSGDTAALLVRRGTNTFYAAVQIQ